MTSCSTFGSDKDIAAEYYAIAEGYTGTSKYDKAIDYYEKAARYKNFANAAHYGLARVYALSGKWDESCALLDELYAQDNANEMITTAYAFALASEGRSVKALGLYEAIWKAHADDPQAGRNYAEILVLVQRYQDALDLIDELKKKFPDADAMKGIDELAKKAEAALNPAESTDGTATDPAATDGKAAPDGTAVKDAPAKDSALSSGKEPAAAVTPVASEKKKN
jgi:thioredoxin-like negative regulator of GroEL